MIPHLKPKDLSIQRTPDITTRKRYAAKSRGRAHPEMGVCHFFAALFDLNERLPKSRKMTDEEIKRQVLSEFPERKSLQRLAHPDSRQRVTVNYYRALYNTGRLTSGEIPPQPSVRYDIDGNVVRPKRGSKRLLVESPSG